MKDAVRALDQPEPSRAEELAQIDRHAQEGGVNLWVKPSTDQRV